VGSVLVRILVVDDNPTVRHYLRAILEQHTAWRVWEARTGEEALTQIRSSPPDLVVLDFRMPDLNGLELARQIGREHPGTPILMVTVYLSAELAAEAKAAGIRGACAKSDIGSLVQAAETVLRKETYFPGPRSQDGVAM
jgi:two-component system, NarL family, invasion response regulator UvrY